MEPFPSSASKFSFEYLLLPPRSAPTAAPPQAHAQGFAMRPPRPPTHRGLALAPTGRCVGRALKRHPFSGLVDSAGNQLLDGSISPFAPIPKSDERFARQYRCGPPPEFPLASPRSGIVHHLSGPDRHAHTRTPSQKIKPNGVPTGRCREHAGYIRRDGACCQPRSTATASPRAYRQLWALAAAPIRTGPRPESIGGPAIAVPHPTGTHRRPPFASLSTISSTSLTLFSKSFSSFPSRVLVCYRSHRLVFSLGRNLPRGATGSGHDGALTLSGAPFQGTWARSAAEDASPDYNSDSQAARFSSWADPGSLAVTKGILVHVHGSFCFAGFDNDPSAERRLALSTLISSKINQVAFLFDAAHHARTCRCMTDGRLEKREHSTRAKIESIKTLQPTSRSVSKKPNDAPRAMPSLHRQQHTGNPPDTQGKLSLVALLKRYARVEVAAQADIQPPVTNQTPLMHLYGRHPRRPSS
ncbi:hypothetical protein L2E82_51838 [Cichorium intybus]|nr:hypothetical protein L2E82_51838 [Cichorium intybus]